MPGGLPFTYGMYLVYPLKACTWSILMHMVCMWSIQDSCQVHKVCIWSTKPTYVTGMYVVYPLHGGMYVLYPLHMVCVVYS